MNEAMPNVVGLVYDLDPWHYVVRCPICHEIKQESTLEGDFQCLNDRCEVRIKDGLETASMNHRVQSMIREN